MVLSRKILKKVPLPSYLYLTDDPKMKKLDLIVRTRFREMFGVRHNISTSERIRWGQHLASLSILWGVWVSRNPHWDGWEFAAANYVRPVGLDGHVRLGNYYFPADLVTRILVLGYMP